MTESYGGVFRVIVSCDVVFVVTLYHDQEGATLPPLSLFYLSISLVFTIVTVEFLIHTLII